MKVVGFAGFSGAGKTTLVERLIPELTLQGLRVSVVKHAHHTFDIDHPGKDSYRHRQAGAYEVLIASDQRMALMRELTQSRPLTVHEMLAELDEGVDWVLVEGFKQSNLPKVEVWRSATGKPARYPQDACVVAIATDTQADLPQATELPLLDLAQPDAIVAWLLAHQDQFEYSCETLT